MDISTQKIFSFGYNSGAVFKDVIFEGYELTYFLNGSGHMTSGSDTLFYKANDILFSNPEYKRTLTCDEQTSYLCIRFYSKTPIKDLFAGIYPCQNEAIFELFKTIYNENKEKKYRYFDYCNSLTWEILILLSRQIAQNTINDKNIHELIKQIDTSLSFNMSIGEMADMLNYNYDYFRQKFKSVTGQSPTNYIANRRIENACNLLKKNMYSCTEISNLCGFSTPSQFSKLFKQEMGISPLAYHKNIKNSN